MSTRHGIPLQPDQRLGGRLALEHALFGLIPILVTGWTVYWMYAKGIAAVDFGHSFWLAGWRTLHGLDPYSWTRHEIAAGVSFPYPAVTALLLAPFGLLSSVSWSVPITTAGVLAAPLSLWILGVRDWRAYGIAALWAPVVVAWQAANFTLLLVVGAALLWRFRERDWLAAALVALLVSIKPIMAPLWLWLVLMRRWRPACLAVVIGVAINAAAWSVLGWRELGGWLSLLSRQGSLRDGDGYSLIALAAHVGVSWTVGEVLIVAFGSLLLSIAAIAAQRQREFGVFGAAILLTIVISPQADVHYFAMLLVPLALARPRLACAWLVPLVLWVCPATRADWWQIVLWWGLVAVLAREFLAAQSAGSRADGVEVDVRLDHGLSSTGSPAQERARAQRG